MHLDYHLLAKQLMDNVDVIKFRRQMNLREIRVILNEITFSKEVHRYK